MSSNGALEQEISHRIQSGWRNWKNVSGVLYDKNISVRIKGNLYRTLERPTMLYGAEVVFTNDAWSIKEDQERRLDVTEMRLLRWMYEVTRLHSNRYPKENDKRQRNRDGTSSTDSDVEVI
ncbi:uncharacterized protein LOC134764249 [Penaeus indicus]|uniref:uncharacterized protein LOC134764249 n=1 Tax=Penaeus indicus TaxID=29960 RepID=UPI00300CA5B5